MPYRLATPHRGCDRIFYKVSPVPEIPSKGTGCALTCDRLPNAVAADDVVFRHLVDETREIAIFLMDLSGRIETWNAGARRIFGFEPEEAIGRHFAITFVPEDRRDGAPDRELGIARENAQLKVQVQQSEATQASMLADVRDLRERIQAMESKAATTLTVLAPEDRDEAPAPIAAAMPNAFAPAPPPPTPESTGPKVITIGAPSTSTDQTIRLRCEREWPTDFRMRTYCEQQQERAKRLIEARTPSSMGLTIADFENIRRSCRSEWMDDYKMRDSCERRQAELWRSGSQGE